MSPKSDAGSVDSAEGFPGFRVFGLKVQTSSSTLAIKGPQSSSQAPASAGVLPAHGHGAAPAGYSTSGRLNHRAESNPAPAIALYCASDLRVHGSTSSQGVRFISVAAVLALASSSLTCKTQML